MTDTTQPPNIRPHQHAHDAGDQRVTTTPENGGRRQTWRQIGWHGQSGAFYSLAEDPSKHEPGSFSPLWILVEDEPILAGRDPVATMRTLTAEMRADAKDDTPLSASEQAFLEALELAADRWGDESPVTEALGRFAVALAEED